MRRFDLYAEAPAPRAFRWTPARVLVIVSAYAAPFALLCLKLQDEMKQGTLSLDRHMVLMRFIVVGLFAMLLSHWCMHWMKKDR